MRAEKKLEELTLLPSGCDSGCDLAARLIRFSVRGDTWAILGETPLHYFYRACKKYGAIRDTKRSHDQEVSEIIALVLSPSGKYRAFHGPQSRACAKAERMKIYDMP